MLFNSLEFALFFPIAAAVYFLLPQVWRVRWLLLVSCVFYMAFIPAYILILIITILIDYFAGIYIEKSHGSARRSLLLLSIISTCLVLGIFKYLNFLLDTAHGISSWLGLGWSHSALSIILPVGLSFHTFQSLSYVIEVYRGHQRAEKDFVVYATYVMFFPQLVAGPIERPQNLLGQFRERHTWNYQDVTWGLKRMAWGFFKKLVVADRLALYVNDVYGAPREFNGLQLVIATIFFAYQIYCDFSGYSDIAIGCARIIGFRLMENFRTPYDSLSVSEFWRRWHISLSTWFKDYVYLPLGGNRVGALRHVFNLLATFGLSGLWHGANWTYVWWGLLNGTYLVAGSFTKDVRSRVFDAVGLGPGTWLRVVLMRLTTFGLICFAWIFFRAQSLTDAFYIAGHLGSGWNLDAIRTPQFLLRQMPIAIGAILLLELGEHLMSKGLLSQWGEKMPVLPRWAVYAGFVMFVVMFGVYRKTQFIYFQF